LICSGISGRRTAGGKLLALLITFCHSEGREQSAVGLLAGGTDSSLGFGMTKRGGPG
jgi:hypothetical protein